MEYLDFELQLSEGSGDGAYRVEVLRSPAGEINATMRWSFDDEELARRIQEVEATRGNEEPTRKTGHRAVVRDKPPNPPVDVKELGQDLFDALLSPEVRASYRTSLAEARRDGKGLRVRLRIEVPKLAALPWEYLYDEAEGAYLGLSTETPLVRYIELGRGQAPLKITPPLRILGMVASPLDVAQLDVDRERAQMEEAVQHLTEAGYVELTWLEGQTWRDLRKALSRGTWNVFHFIGHGGFDEEKGEGLIVLADEEGTAYQLGAEELGILLNGHPSMRLAVLNACEGARASETSLFSSAGSVLIRRGIPAVVSMQYEITDRAALEFARTFYETLADGLPMDAAVKEARKSIRMAVRDVPEWATPVLHMRTPDGRLFDFDVAGAIFGTEATQQKPPAPEPPPPEPSAPPPSPSVSAVRKRLMILLKRVRQFWVDGVLNQSLHRSTLIELGLDAMPAMVDSPWGSLPMSSEQSITSVFEEMGGSLLILGEPGSGKTTLMLTLARDLLDHAERDATRPIPVVFNLSSWASTGGKLSDWMAAELSAKYQVPKKIGQSWVEAGHLLLLLDGLDEVLAEKRAACVEAINAFSEEAGLASVVVCCRLKEYLGLPIRLGLNGAVRLRLLSKEQVLAYVAQAGPSLTSLQTALQQDSSLLTLAETPFMLSMMARTYQGVPVEALASEAYATIEARRQQLMQAYVQRQFRLAAGGMHG